MYQVEKSLNSLQWKRSSEIITIGTLTDSDGYDTVKQKCASAFGVIAGDEDLVLTRGNAKIDRSAFPSLGMYLGFLSQQQRARVSFGIGVEVCSMLHMYMHIVAHLQCTVHFTLHT